MTIKANSGHLIPILALLLSSLVFYKSPRALADPGDFIELPQPQTTGKVSVEEALKSRRSVRRFRSTPLSLDEVSQLLWAAQGKSSHRYRTAPSAGALYPLDVYVVAGRVDGLEAGVYRYDSRRHALHVVSQGDARRKLFRAALDQEWVREGAIALVFSAVYERTTGKYGNRGIRYVHIEVGHAMQNVYLQAEALGLGTVTVGAFSDSSVKELLHLDDEQQPLGIMPVGRAWARE